MLSCPLAALSGAALVISWVLPLAMMLLSGIVGLFGSLFSRRKSPRRRSAVAQPESTARRHHSLPWPVPLDPETGQVSNGSVSPSGVKRRDVAHQGIARRG